jgi:hypothetical protein
MRSRWKLALWGILVIGAITLGSAVYLFTSCPVRVSVRNETNQRVTGITVDIQRQRLAFPDLQPGEVHKLYFHNTGLDSHYVLTARLSDGTPISKADGYITSGFLCGRIDFSLERSGSVIFKETYYP